MTDWHSVVAICPACAPTLPRAWPTPCRRSAATIGLMTPRQRALPQAMRARKRGRATTVEYASGRAVP